MSSSDASQAVGKICPYCRTTIEPGLAVVICPQCGLPHHADCWEENGRCTTFGCQGGAPATAAPPPEDRRYLQERPCPVCGFIMRPHETTCPYCRNNIFTPRTPARGSLPRGSGAHLPHRGRMVLAAGVLSLVMCCALFGLAAWTMANEDLRAMNAGVMDESGRAATEVGRVLGITSVGLTLIVLLGLLLRLAAGI